jgi:hypothetical protein
MNNNWNFAKKDLKRLTILVLIFRFRKAIRFKRLPFNGLEIYVIVVVAPAAAVAAGLAI